MTTTARTVKKSNAGRKPDLPTEAQRKAALVYFGTGATQAQVAKKLGKSVDWVRYHLANEFEEGYEYANVEIYGALYNLGVRLKNPAALIFLAKNRLGMTDRAELNHGGHMPTQRTEIAVNIVHVRADASTIAIPAQGRKLLPVYSPSEPTPDPE